VNVAAIRAAVQGSDRIDSSLLDWARDRVLMGSERRSAQLSAESRKLTAYHEGGHAIVALRTPAAMPLHKATIMPRGSSLGMVTQLPDKDETSISLLQMRARLDVCMGGRVAEELVFGADSVTSGARSDLQQATSLVSSPVAQVAGRRDSHGPIPQARHMVTECGMSDMIGPMYVAESSSSRYKASAETDKAVDEEIRRLLRESYERVRTLLRQTMPELELLAAALLEHETLTADQVRAVISGQAPVAPDADLPAAISAE
jgi:ATP-dependent metalloprotease